MRLFTEKFEENLLALIIAHNSKKSSEMFAELTYRYIFFNTESLVYSGSYSADGLVSEVLDLTRCHKSRLSELTKPRPSSECSRLMRCCLCLDVQVAFNCMKLFHCVLQFSGRPFAGVATSVPTKPCPSNVIKTSKSETLKVLITCNVVICSHYATNLVSY